MNSRSLLFFTLVLLSACDLMTQREPASQEPSKNIILTYFISNMYPMSDEDISSKLSEFFGSGISATADSSYENWRSPRLTCDYSSSFGVKVSPKRALNLGALTVRHGENSVKVAAARDFSWSFTGSLPASNYDLSLDGMNGTAKFTQTYSVLEASTEILTYIGNLQATAFQIPSPTIPTSGTASFDLHLSRGQPFIVKVAASEGVNYWRVRVRDGSNRDTGDVTCFGLPGDNISIPPSLMATFRTGSDGLIEIDQLSVSHLENIAKVKESIVLSNTRQIHGTIEYLNTSGQLDRLEVGKLHIDP